MKIKRGLNNNAVISSNSQNGDVLLLGSGIAFQKKAGQEVDPQRVEKTFLLKDKEAQNRFTELMIDVPMAHILVSEKIVNYAKIKLGRPLSEIIYVNLTDHIHSAIERCQEGIQLKWDIARFYAEEHAVGRKALEIIKHDLGVEMEDDEAAFIESEYGYEFDRSELLYLSVHINRIVKNL